MKKNDVILPVLFFFGFFVVLPVNSFAQVMQKLKPVAKPAQALIAAITPSTLCLQQGGPAAIVAVDGQYLDTILSVLAVRQGERVPEIAVKLVQPWPSSKKIELKAAANAPVAQGYQLRFMGKIGIRDFRIDAPLSMFSLDVTALKQMQQMTLPPHVRTTNPPAIMSVKPSNQLKIQNVFFSPDPVALGNSTNVKILLDGPAPEQGASISIFHDEKLWSICPTSLTIRSGMNSGSFSATTNSSFHSGYASANFSLNFDLNGSRTCFFVKVKGITSERNLAVTGITPNRGEIGSVVTLEGTGFLAVSDIHVRFHCTNDIGGCERDAQVLEKSDTSLKVKVPPRAESGGIRVIRGRPEDSQRTEVLSEIFTVLRMPKIESFSPMGGFVGSQVILRGYNLEQISFFNNVQAIPVDKGESATTEQGILMWRKIKVPFGATTGPIKAMTQYGAALSAQDFQVGSQLTTPPSITQIAPTTGRIGTELTLSGQNFGQEAFAVIIKFGNVQSSEPPVFCGNDTIRIKVPANADSGKITVETSGGKAVSADTFWLPPEISALQPTQGPVGYKVQIKGKRFSDSSSDLMKHVVKFNGIQASVVQGMAGSEGNPLTALWALVPTGAITGYVTVETPGGAATSPMEFTVTQ